MVLKMELKDLDTLVALFEEYLELRVAANKLFTQEYEPHHQQFRKTVGNVAVAFQECHSGMYKVAAIYRLER